MRTARAKAKTKTLNDIVETLKRVPKARREAVRAVVRALAAPESPTRYAKARAHKKASLVDDVIRGTERPSCSTDCLSQAIREYHMSVVGLIEVRDPATSIDKKRLRHGCFPYSTSSTRCEARGSPDSPQPAAARKCWRAVS